MDQILINLRKDPLKTIKEILTDGENNYLPGILFLLYTGFYVVGIVLAYIEIITINDSLGILSVFLDKIFKKGFLFVIPMFLDIVISYFEKNEKEIRKEEIMIAFSKYFINNTIFKFTQSIALYYFSANFNISGHALLYTISILNYKNIKNNYLKIITILSILLFSIQLLNLNFYHTFPEVILGTFAGFTITILINLIRSKSLLEKISGINEIIDKFNKLFTQDEICENNYSWNCNSPCVVDGYFGCKKE